jgi:hypothetical protein
MVSVSQWEMTEIMFLILNPSISTGVVVAGMAISPKE